MSKAEAPVTPAETKPAKWRPNIQKSVAVVVGASVVAHALMLALFGNRHHGAEQAVGEVSLGKYRFMNAEKTPAVGGATFALHINLIGEVDAAARARLALRKFKVQQSVEELLRQAHAADFEDPALAELKRQLQERINDSLEMRAVKEVIVTELALQNADQTQVVTANSEEQTPEAKLVERALHDATAPAAATATGDHAG